MRRVISAILFAVGLSLVIPAGSALAGCSILAFEVNDYGKKGPTADAKRLLDKHIVDWAKKHKLKSYRKRGKKKVSCYLFLDVGLFDEWTCKAEQTVCYRGKKLFD